MSSITAVTIAGMTVNAGSSPVRTPNAAIAQLVEHSLGRGEVIGSTPFCSSNENAGGARLVVQLICNQQAVGSSPISSSRKIIKC